MGGSPHVENPDKLPDCVPKLAETLHSEHSVSEMLQHSELLSNKSINETDCEDEMLIVCSDGVWEFISSQEAVEIVQNQKQEIDRLNRNMSKKGSDIFSGGNI